MCEDEELLEDMQTPCFSSMYSSDSNSNSLEIQNRFINSETSDTKEAKEYNLFSNIKHKREVNFMFRSNYNLVYRSSKFSNINEKLRKGKSLECIDFSNSSYGNKLNTLICICQGRAGDKLSISLPDLRAFTPNVDFTDCEICATPFACRRFTKDVSIRSNIVRSMLNLNFMNDCIIPVQKRRDLFCHRRTEASFLPNALNDDWILVPMSSHYFRDALFKMLINRLHSEHESAIEKDEIIFEFQQIYDKLLLKYAEAENIIDRMRFGEVMSTITETTTVNNTAVDLVRNTPTMKNVSTNKWNESWDSIKNQLDEIEVKKSSTQDIDLENPYLDNMYNERAFRRLTTVSRNEKDIQHNVEFNENCDCFMLQKEIYNYEKDLNGSISVNQKVIKEPPEKDNDVLSQCGIAVHFPGGASNMNVEKYNTQFPQISVYSPEEMLSDCKISISSLDDFSVVDSRNCESLDSMGLPSIQNRSSNNGQDCYNNKVCVNTNQKRDIIARPKIDKYCPFLKQQNEHFFHSLPVFDIDHCDLSSPKTFVDQRTCKPTVSLTCEKHNSDKESIMLKPSHNIVDTVHRQFEGITLTGEVDIKSSLNPKNEEQDFQRCFFDDKTGSNLKMFDGDLKEMRKCSLNERNLEIRNDFGGSHSKSYICDGHWDKTKIMEEFSLDKSDSDVSHDLPSVELEACDCWHEFCFPKVSPVKMTQANCNREELLSYNSPQISPLCLEISSSSMDFSLPTISPVLMESSKNYAALSSNEVRVEHDKRMEENSLHQIPASHRYITRITSNCAMNCMTTDVSRIMKSQKNEISKQINKKNVTHLLNSLNKADCLAVKLKDRSEQLKKYLAQQLDNIP